MTAVLRIATCVAAADLMPGDVLTATAIGGYSGTISRVHVEGVPADPGERRLSSLRVYVYFEEPGPPACMHGTEVCEVLRVAGREIRQAG